MPGKELYLIESKPTAVCIQVLLEFFIFVIAALLWLTWCTQHVQAKTNPEAKSLAFSLPGYMQGWVCLMVSRLSGSRLKEKFCFSFYLASGIRFMTSAAILFPEFTSSWFPVVYGLIALLCFITTIFHIVTQTNPEKRQVRRLIRPDGTLEDKPVNEMMTVQQLETYRDVIRNYIEKRDKEDDSEDEPYYVKSVSVITVRLRDSLADLYSFDPSQLSMKESKIHPQIARELGLEKNQDRQLSSDHGDDLVGKSVFFSQSTSEELMMQPARSKKSRLLL